jgi:hypothetical protein
MLVKDAFDIIRIKVLKFRLISVMLVECFLECIVCPYLSYTLE